MWTPTLGASDNPAYARLADALALDVAEGRLSPGDRLPTQRDLAYRLALSLGTVTRAYAEAERRGLIKGEVGRGSFVAERARGMADGEIDLARNLPPAGIAERVFAPALARIARRADAANAFAYAPSGGLEAHRRAGAHWLGRTAAFTGLDPERVICVAGAQQGMAVTLGALCEPGDAIVAEAATFAGLKSLAAYGGYRLIAAQLDAEGMTPDGLARAAHETGARVAYVLPFQNPTARVMSAARRREIVSVAREFDLTLVEDDIYAPYAADPPLTPLAVLAPERTAYVSSLSKTLGPGLRFGYVVMPTATQRDRALDILRAIAFGAPALGGVVATELIDNGAAFEVLAAAREELRVRGELARRILGERLEAGAPAASPHLWAPMSELDAERIAGRAARAGVALTPPRSPFLDGEPVTGLRICLGGARDLAQLETGLTRLLAAPSDAADHREVV